MKKFILKTFVFLISAVSANAQWQADDRLTIDSAISKTSYNNASSVAANESNVHVVWYDNRHGNYEIFYKRSTDDGVSWGTDTRLTNNFASSTTPSVSAVGQLVHVIWEEFRDGNSEIYYKRSSNGGSHWGADIRLTTNSFSSRYPSLSVSGHKIHVVWNDDRNGSGNNEIYYKRSTDAGQSWGTDTRLTNNSHFSYFPTISVYQENVHVAWNDNRDGHMEIYYKRSTDGGLFWGPDTRITSYSSNPSSNSISASGPHVHLTYIDQRNSQTKVYYKRSPDGGTSWGPETSLSINYQDCVNPYIVASGQSVHFVYQYYSQTSLREIYYGGSTDGGLNWVSYQSLTVSPADAYYPFLAISGQSVHVVWYDKRDRNEEIYYKRNPTGNPIGITNIGSEIPSEFTLRQNYPNPFNPATNINFSITKADFVKLVVYDITGREISMLVNEQLTAGSYNVDFDASQLPSGTYFYRLTAGEFTETKKMILIK